MDPAPRRMGERSSFVPQLSMGSTPRAAARYSNGNSALTHPFSALSSIHADASDDHGGWGGGGDSYKYGNWLTSNNNTTMSGTGSGSDSRAAGGTLDTLLSRGTGADDTRRGGDGGGARRPPMADESSPTPLRMSRTAVGGGGGGGGGGGDSWRVRSENGWGQRRGLGVEEAEDEAANKRVTIPRWHRSVSGSRRTDPNVFYGTATTSSSAAAGTRGGGERDTRGLRWSTTHIGSNRVYPRGGETAEWRPSGLSGGGERKDYGMVDSPGRFAGTGHLGYTRWGTTAFRGANTLSTSTSTAVTSTSDSSTSSSTSTSSSSSSSSSSDESSSSPSTSLDDSGGNGDAEGGDRVRPFNDLRGFRPSSNGHGFSFGKDGLVNDNDDDEDRATIASMLTNDIDLDALPVVPDELLQRVDQHVFQWNRHPSHSIVLLLLQHRGIYLPRYRGLVDYHMSELFLHYLDVCREGSYFVYYAADKWPKERFFRICMLPLHRMATESEPVPQLVVTMHQSGVAIVDAIPLDFLVGLTTTPRAPCFRPFLESPNTILGCREGRGHRTRLPVDGCFSLWFYDREGHAARSVDLLTCDPKIYDIWTKTFMGLVSVNSSSVVQIGIDPDTLGPPRDNEVDSGNRSGSGSANEARMAELTRAAQLQVEADMAAGQEVKKRTKPSS